MLCLIINYVTYAMDDMVIFIHVLNENLLFSISNIREKALMTTLSNASPEKQFKH